MVLLLLALEPYADAVSERTETINSEPLSCAVPQLTLAMGKVSFTGRLLWGLEVKGGERCLGPEAQKILSAPFRMFPSPPQGTGQTLPLPQLPSSKCATL